MATKEIKEEFLSSKKVIPTRLSRVKTLDEPTHIKIFLYGNWGTGKTYFIVGLLELGFKVFVVSTDIGGSGLNTVKLHILNVLKKPELLKNIKELVLNSDDEMQQFVDKPSAYYPEIYDFDPDFLFWDGFGAWQQSKLKDKIGDMPLESKKHELAPAVAAGYQFEMTQWGMLSTATMRTLDKFCALHNAKTGKLWHKAVTALEGLKSKPIEGQQASELKETKEPLLQGSGGVMSGAAFDLIIRCKKTSSTDGNDKFWYQFKGENKRTKLRGFNFPPQMEANPVQLWQEIEKQAGIVRGAVDKTMMEN